MMMTAAAALLQRARSTGRLAAAAIATVAVAAPTTAHAGVDPAAMGELGLRYAENMARSSSDTVCGQSPDREAAGIVGALLGGAIGGFFLARTAKELADASDGWRQCYGAVVQRDDGLARLLVNFDSSTHAQQSMRRLGARRVLAVFNDPLFRCGAAVRSSGGLRSRLFAGVGETASVAEKTAIEACRNIEGDGAEWRIALSGECNRWARP